MRFVGRGWPLVGLVAAAMAVSPLAAALAPTDRGGPGEAERLCGSLSVIRLPSGSVMCTHGPDPAPAGVDLAVAQPLVVPGEVRARLFPESPRDVPAPTAAPEIACYGDGQSGNRVQAVYAVPADRPDRYPHVVASIREWAAEMDAVFEASAVQTGGIRRVRFVTDPACQLVVERVVVSARGDDTFENTIAELAAAGYDRSDRKYVVWMDSRVLCGIATYYIDDRPVPANANNGAPGLPGSVARIDSGCWGLGSRGGSVEAHELMHSLGSVQPTAPNANVNGHCHDDADRMCYPDGSRLLVMMPPCPSSREPLFDCGHDDYFSTAPAQGNYLSTHWNTANSSFLAGRRPRGS